LAAMDRRTPEGPWTAKAMELIDQFPGRPAEVLAREAGQDKVPFKACVRKLKTLGLTESLEVGYRLSPRGRRILAYRRGAP
jgi:hypothetical protein